jgi:hypothetical protein
MAANLLVQIGAILVVIFIFVLMIVWKRMHYVISGVTLSAVGILTFLLHFGKIKFDVGDYPILIFALYFYIAFAGKDLIKEGFKEKESKLKYPSIILGIILVLINIVPTLHKLHVIDWVLPQNLILDATIYTVSGLFLIIGAFTILATKED